MKTTTAALLFAFTTAAYAQTGYSSTVTLPNDVTVYLQSNLEPPTPAMAETFRTGTRTFATADSAGKHRMQRFLADVSQHQYFGYDLLVERIADTGDFRVTLAPLSATPAELGLPAPGDWKSLPTPMFPAPEIVHPRDRMALDLFQNPHTGQKIVDYIRIEAATPQCAGQAQGKQDLACLTSLLDDANRVLARTVDASARRNSARETSIRHSQVTWAQYKADVCSSVQDKTKRVQCELTLTNSRIDELNNVY